jgi:integrase
MVPNLYLVISPKGKKSWRWMAKNKATNKQSKLTFGPWPSFPLTEAREWASERNAERDRGLDPVALIAAVEAAKVSTDALTIKAVYNSYVKHKEAVGEAVKSMHEKVRLIERNVYPAFGNTPIATFTKTDVREVLRVIRERGAPVTANRVLSELKTFLGWADHEDYVEHNVATSFKPTKEEGYRRHTTLEDMAYIWRATWMLENKDAGRAFRLILLTGCRRMEATAAKSVEYRDGHWTVPRERSKNKLPCILPLPSEGRTLFEASADLEYVFHDNPRSDSFQKPLHQIRVKVDALAGRKLEHWDLHGIRHGVRTALRGKRITTKEIAERILNHNSGGIDERYDHELYLDEKGEALVKWQALLLSEVAKQTGANVVPLVA